MRIILYEIRKIWNWKIIGLLIIMATLYYQMFLYYPIEHFRTSHPHIEIHDLAVEMTERYGSRITEDEFEEFKNEKKYVAELEMETYLIADELAKEAGISNAQDYQEFVNDYFNGALHEEDIKLDIDDKILLDEEIDDLQYQLQAVDYLEEEITLGEGSNGILDTHTFESTMTYIRDLAILVVLLTLILVAPLVVSDRSKNIHFLQYTSKNGRRILGQQLSATILSTILLTTINVIGFGSLILRNDILTFWDNDVHSFLNLGMTNSFFDFTFGEYLSIAILFIYLLSMSIALVAFVLSRFSQNRITLVMKGIPVFALLAVICHFLFIRTFSPFNRLYHLTNIVGSEGMLLSLLLIIGIIIVMFTVKREKRMDVY